MAFTYSYSTIADSAVDPDSPIDTALMTALRNNIVYNHEYIGGKSYTPAEPHDHDGSNSAPVNITAQSQLSASIVGQSQLKTTTSANSLAVNSAGSASFTLAGGQYSFWTPSADNPTINPYGVMFGNGNVAAGLIGVYNGDSTLHFFYVDERYVQASPPYRDGPHFAFLAIDAGGQIRHTWFANDPPWAYHGPTQIVPQRIVNGRAFRLRRLIDGMTPAAALRSATTLAALAAGTAVITDQLIEITPEYKDSDKSIVPHPFLGADTDGLSIVLLEPGTRLMERFAEFCDEGEARGLRELALAGGFVIDNTRLAYPGPPGVAVHRVKLK
jgi:hypothetical protein